MFYHFTDFKCFKNINEIHFLKKIVYLELLRRRYKVSIGKTLDYAIVKNIINWLLENEE